MKKIRLIFLTGFLLAFYPNFAITSDPISYQDKTVNQVAKRVTKAEFQKKLKSIDDIVLIDVRTPREFNGGNITGAINIDFNSPSFKAQINKLNKSKPTLIYCHSGGRSAQVLKQFKAMGFDYVLELEGGYSKW